MNTVILQGKEISNTNAETITQQLKGTLLKKTTYCSINFTGNISTEQLQSWRDSFNFDVNYLPTNFKPQETRLLVTDMDSTLINIECVDEIADFINVKPQVAEITEAAMRGEIDFATSLRKRVSLLKGLDVTALERVYTERLKLNPGAETMIKGLQQQGIKTALVSGGFTFFTERLKQRLGLDFTMANVLGEYNGRLTGEVIGDICGAQAKADFLQDKCKQLNIFPSQVVAMGDGANDLLMMDEAGLSIAYHAKPKVQIAADVAFNYSGLDGVLELLQIELE